jgi:hypothetical protein
VALKSKAYRFAGGTMSASDFQATLAAIEDNLNEGQEYPLDSIMDVLELVGHQNIGMVREVPELKHALLHTVNAVLRAHEEMSSPIDVPRAEDHNLLAIATGMQEALTRHQKTELRIFGEGRGESRKGDQYSRPDKGKQAKDHPGPHPRSDSWAKDSIRFYDPKDGRDGPKL